MTGRLLLLLFLCSLGSIHGCDKVLYKDMFFDGKFVDSGYAVTVKHCQLQCTEQAECQFFVYNDEKASVPHGCYMFKSEPDSGEPTSTFTYPSVTSGYSLKSCAEKPEFNWAEVYTNMDFIGKRNVPGGIYRSLFTPNYEECQRTCTHDPTCQYFSWRNGKFAKKEIRYKCTLGYSVTIPEPSIRWRGGFYSGFSRNIQVSTNQYFGSACENKVFERTVILGEKLDYVNAKDFEQCSTLCSYFAECTHFTFDGRNCALKKNLTEFVTKYDRRKRSGLVSRLCQQDRTWVSAIYGQQEFKIFNTNPWKNVKDVKNPKACQDICTEDFNCQVFSYNKGNCYLMREITSPRPGYIIIRENMVSGFTLKKQAGIGHQGTNLCSPTLST